MSGKIFVTGAGGWLGRTLVQHLRAEPGGGALEIYGLFRDAEEAKPLEDSVRPVFGDVTDASGMSRFAIGAGAGDIVFHLAGVIHPSRASQFYSVNTEGTRNVAEAFKNKGLAKFVHMSSNSPFGTNPSPHHLFDEVSAYHPYMGYGKSKMRAEKVVRDLDVKELPWTIVRAPWFYGPYQPERQTTFFRMIRQGKMPIFSGGVNRRSMAYTENLAQGLKLAAHNPKSTREIFWIADAEPYAMRDIVGTVRGLLADEFGMKVSGEARSFPGLICEVAYACDSLIQGLGLYHQKIHVLSEMNKTIACSIVKARNVLGYQPRFDLKQGMRQSIQWCLKQGFAI